MTRKKEETFEVTGSSSVGNLADCIMKNPALTRQLELLGFKPKSIKGMTFREAMVCSQITNAVKGDLKSYRAIMEYINEETEDTMPLIAFARGKLDGPLKKYRKKKG